jgi:hypothetical protein
MGKISKEFRNGFDTYSKSQNIWDLYTIPFKTENEPALRKNVIKAFKENNKVKFTKLDDLIITDAIYFSLNCNKQKSETKYLVLHF